MIRDEIKIQRRVPRYLIFTCIISRHCPQVVVKLSPPLVGRFEPVCLEQVVEEGEQHGVVVGQHKQVDG